MVATRNERDNDPRWPVVSMRALSGRSSLSDTLHPCISTSQLYLSIPFSAGCTMAVGPLDPLHLPSLCWLLGRECPNDSNRDRQILQR